MLLLNLYPHGFSSPSQSHYTPGVVITLCGDETAPFFGFLGAVAALFFSCVPKTSSVSNVSPRPGTEAAHGTAKSGVVASMGVMRLVLVMNSIVPVVVAVVLGLACGLAGLLAGMVIGFVGDTGVRKLHSSTNDAFSVVFWCSLSIVILLWVMGLQVGRRRIMFK